MQTVAAPSAELETARAHLVASFRSEVRLWKQRAGAADRANDDASWRLAMAGLNRAEAELAGLARK